jgi:hypothetical protein
MSDNRPINRRVCDEFCRMHHGQGYNQTDILTLWKMYNAKRKEVNGPLKPAEVEELLTILDTQRGRPPAWRQK